MSLSLPTHPTDVACPYCHVQPGEECERVAPWGGEPWDSDEVHHSRRVRLREERERVDRESQTGLFGG